MAVNLQRNAQTGGAHHLFFQDLRHLLLFSAGRLDQKLIVNLQNDAGAQSPAAELLPHADHRRLHDIGTGPLYGCIHCHALAELPLHEIRALKLRHGAAPSKECLGIPLLFGILHLFVQEGLDPREHPEIRLDVFLRLRPGDREILREAEGADPVDNTEIHRLGIPALQRGDLLIGRVEHLCRRSPVNVAVLAVGLDQCFIARHGRQDAELNLRVIRIRKNKALPGNKHFADGSSLLGPHGNVLEIRVRRADAPGCRNGLMEGRMDALIPGDIPGQSVRIGGFELRKAAVFQHLCHNVVLRRQLLQDICRSGITAFRLLSARKSHLFKKDLSQLLGACDVKLASRRLVNGLLQLADPIHQLLAVLGQLVRQHADADVLHIVQDIRERQLHPLVQLQHLCRFKSLPHERSRLRERPAGLLRVGCRPLWFTPVKGLHRIFPQKVIAALDGLSQILCGNVLRLIVVFQRIQKIRTQEDIHDAVQMNPVPEFLSGNLPERELRLQVENSKPQLAPTCLPPKLCEALCELRCIRRLPGRHQLSCCRNDELLSAAVFLCRQELHFPILENGKGRYTEVLRHIARRRRIHEREHRSPGKVIAGSFGCICPSITCCRCIRHPRQKHLRKLRLQLLIRQRRPFTGGRVLLSPGRRGCCRSRRCLPGELRQKVLEPELRVQLKRLRRVQISKPRALQIQLHRSIDLNGCEEQ